jgi:hypothetical protein
VGVFSTAIKSGDIFSTYQGFTVEVIEYLRCNKILVKFQDTGGAEKLVATKELLLGSIKNPYHPSKLDIGFVGVGPYSSRKGGRITKEYMHWSSMFTRCYDPAYHERFPTYKTKYVDEQWYNYQEFAEWCQWQVGFGTGVLDKDLLFKGNDAYSPETCVFLPSELNSLIVTQDTKGKTTPAGISYQTSHKSYLVSCAIKGKNKNLGRYKCPEEAFAVYKGFKEELVRGKAEQYKDQIDIRAYTALSNFTV